jgi:hypothetical protein
MSLPDGIVAVVKQDCPTCELVIPVLGEIRDGAKPLTIYTQDDPAFPAGMDVVDDTDLDISCHNDIETVPTLIRVSNGVEAERTVGWSRDGWQSLTGIESLGADLPEMRPGCGSLSVDPTIANELRVRFSSVPLQARRVDLATLEDPIEAAFDRGWSDGLPVVPPTESRVLSMLDGTSRGPGDFVCDVPPDLSPLTVEHVAINAVMAGCKPEYMPVLLAAVEAACSDEFNMHGLLATTYFSGPIIIVNGPIAKAIGMNSEGNAFGQGNRANSTIGRALQLIVRNVGGGRPGQVDMAMQGSPSKLGFCFAEKSDDSPFEALATTRGLPPETNAVTLFAGQGPTPIIDQLSRNPESLARSFAGSLRAAGHHKLVIGFDTMLAVGPEHGRVFSEAGWDKTRLASELQTLLTLDTDELITGVGGITEGLPEAFAGTQLPKFRDGGMNIIHVGGPAGLFSSLLTGWVGGSKGSELVTKEITP